jgi:hypothetical protein
LVPMSMAATIRGAAFSAWFSIRKGHQTPLADLHTGRPKCGL